MTTRAERAEQVRILREQGLTQKVVAERLGIGRAYVSSLEVDPSGEKEATRRDRYRGTCLDCGIATSGADGFSGQSVRCSPCAGKHQHETRSWTKETTLEGLRKYAEFLGHQPISSDLLYNRPGPWCPPVAEVLGEWGTWSAAMEALGYESRVGIKIKSQANQELRRQGMAEYRVLEQDEEDGGWHERDTVNGQTQEAALARYLKDHEQPDDKVGRYLMVPITMFHPRRVRLVMKPSVETVNDF